MLVDSAMYLKCCFSSSNTADVVGRSVHKHMPCAKQSAAPHEALSASALNHCLTKDDQTTSL